MNRRSLLILACGLLIPACGTSDGPSASGAAFPAFAARTGPPVSGAAPTASLSGTWVGARPADGLVLNFSGCGACASAPGFSAGDLVLNFSDSNHMLSGNATVTVTEAPPAGCPAEPECDHGPVGEVMAASVTGSVGSGGRVTMHWEATVPGEGAPALMMFALQGTVSANRMSGTVVLTGSGVPGGSATGTWSVNLR